MQNKFSRRTMLGGLASAPMLPREANDTSLIALGREFNAITAAIDDGGSTALWDRLGPLETAIVAAPAHTIEGFCVKARAACWARLGDLDPTAEATADQRMALSIVRDLIRLYDPRREVPTHHETLLRKMSVARARV
jgi:hypothetical protein